jgi:cytochrome c peroxidase
VIEQLMENERIKSEFAAAFPGEKINIGHVGAALAAFQTQAFAYNDTPYDRYLKGDVTALTADQKKGMDVFFGRGRCGNCHNGEQLSSMDFDSIGVPQIGPGKKDGDDKGRAEVDPEAKPYTFRVPPLRNVALTAPYMHNGVFASLDEVVEHYDAVEASLRGFTLKSQWKNYVEVLQDHDHASDELRLSVLADDLERTREFTVEEEEALIHFIKTGLTDVRLLKNVP